jgi:hypothetical protein
MKCGVVTESHIYPELIKLCWWSWNRLIWDWINNSITHNKAFWIVVPKLSIRGRYLVALFPPNASTDWIGMQIFNYLLVIVLSVYWKEFTYYVSPFLKLIHENLHTPSLKSVVLECVLHTPQQIHGLFWEWIVLYEEVCVANLTGCISQLKVNITHIIHPLPSPGEHAEEQMTWYILNFISNKYFKMYFIEVLYITKHSN